MKTLFVAWQQQNKRGWHPVGRLDADVAAGLYRFRYLHGAVEAAETVGFVPFDSFPDMKADYVAGELFPFFANRLQNSSQPGFREYLRRLDLATDDGEAFDPIEVLAVSEGRRATDNLEIFPRISLTTLRPFKIKFFLHGWRYLPADRAQRVLALHSGDPLRVSIETNNPATGFAVQLQTDDLVVIGYAPRYLVTDLKQAIFRCSVPVSATVSQLNLPPAPPSQRLLISFEGCWPEDYEPMSAEQFQVLVGDETPIPEDAGAAQ